MRVCMRACSAVVREMKKEGRKKQERSNKQTRQSNTVHACIYMGRELEEL